MENNMIIYNNGEIELDVSVDSETVWLTQKQILQLFQKDQSVISRHINKIFQDDEVDEKSNMQKMHIANSDKPVNFYSLDVVLAVGYRTSSKKAIEFRKWATKILKQYIINGYAINSEKITHDRFISLENDVTFLKQNIINLNKLDIKKYNSQYNNLTLKYSNKFHDRFLITDKTTYHLGASLKDLGKKVFAFSKMAQELKV
jgi:hypothetical protein